MYQNFRMMRRLPLSAVVLTVFLGGCTQSMDVLDGIKTSSIGSSKTTAAAYSGSMKERECLARAMFFESHRSSRDGLVAVGTVVMNRVASEKYPDSICAVVGQKNQFAPGVLSRKMNSKALPDVMAAADSVLKGERHPSVRNAQHFHQAGLKFPYNNMHYVLTAGGNSFYERLNRSQLAELRQDGKKPRSQATLAAAKVEPVAETAVAEIAAAPAAPVMAYDVQPQAADAIGAMLANQSRPDAK